MQIVNNPLASLGLRLSAWFERWFPDAFALALVGVALVSTASIATGNTIAQTASWFGSGFWDLTAFTIQISMIIITGYTVATTPVVRKVIQRIALFPQRGATAAAYVALFSMLSSLVSWSFSLIFSGLLAREVTQRVRGADYRAVGAAAYLGVGSVWALGLSSSAALMMASASSLPASIANISGLIPLQQTLGLWQSWLMAAVLLLASVVIAYYSAPDPSAARGMADMGVAPEPAPAPVAKPEKPGEWLEYSPALTIILAVMGVLFLAGEVAAKGAAILLDLNHYIFGFLILGLLLHWRPRSFVRAITAAVPSAAGVFIQYPLYAGIVKIMTESGLAKSLAQSFISVANQQTYPVMLGVYSAVLGLFVPSAGGKWVLEAPYVLDAAKSLHVHLGWTVQTYNASEALANLIHPFWMLPLLGILNLKARDIVGYATLQFAVHVPLVLFLVWALNYTLTYVAPAVP